MSVQNKRILGFVRLFIHKNKTEASQKLDRSLTEASQKLHKSFTEAWQKLDRSLTEAWQKLDRSLTEAWQKLDRSLTEAWQKLDRSFREFPDHCSLKAIVYRIVFLSELESFTGAAMQRRFRRTCPVCGRPDLKNISTHLLQVHGLSSEERKPYLKQTQVSSWQPRVERSPHMTMSYMNVEKPGKQSEHSPPAKRPRTAARTTSLATKSCPEFNSRHKFSLLVVGPTQSGRTYFVQQILENNRIVYEEKKSIRIFWYYNQWQECYEKLKKSLGKSIRFERGVPELSENLCDINARYVQ